MALLIFERPVNACVDILDLTMAEGLTVHVESAFKPKAHPELAGEEGPATTEKKVSVFNPPHSISLSVQ